MKYIAMLLVALVVALYVAPIGLAASSLVWFACAFLIVSMLSYMGYHHESYCDDTPRWPKKETVAEMLLVSMPALVVFIVALMWSFLRNGNEDIGSVGFASVPASAGAFALACVFSYYAVLAVFMLRSGLVGRLKLIRNERERRALNMTPIIGCRMLDTLAGAFAVFVVWQLVLVVMTGLLRVWM